jgi:hypothetical protein
MTKSSDVFIDAAAWLPSTTGITLPLAGGVRVVANTVPSLAYVTISAPITDLRLARIEGFNAKPARATNLDDCSSCASTLDSRTRLMTEIDTSAVINVAAMKRRLNGKTILDWSFKPAEPTVSFFGR